MPGSRNGLVFRAFWVFLFSTSFVSTGGQLAKAVGVGCNTHVHRGKEVRPAAVRPPPPAVTTLSVTMTRPDGGGDPLNSTYGSSDGVFSIAAQDILGAGVADFVTVDFKSSDGTQWTLEFQSVIGTNLSVGIHNQATSANTGGLPGHPGLTVIGPGFDCGANNDVGRFVVLDAQFDFSSRPPAVVSFAAEFEEHCIDCQTDLSGTVYVNSTPTTALSVEEPVIEPGGKTIATLTLSNPAPAGGAVVTMSSVDDSAVAAPIRVTFPAGQTSTQLLLYSTGSRGPRVVPVIASYGGVASFTRVTVQSSGTATGLRIRRLPQAVPDGVIKKKYNFSTQDGQLVAQASSSRTDNLIDTVILHFMANDGSAWEMDFSTQGLARPIMARTYGKVERYPVQDPGFAGLSVSGEGTACNSLKGSFTVVSAAFDYTYLPAKVVNLSVNFKQTCIGDAGLGPDVKGTINFTYSPFP